METQKADVFSVSQVLLWVWEGKRGSVGLLGDHPNVSETSSQESAHECLQQLDSYLNIQLFITSKMWKESRCPSRGE